MSKRRNENGQMRREDYEAEDDDRGSGVAADAFEKGFQRATEDKIRERKIVKARTGPLSRPAKPAASSNTDAVTGGANPFGGFQGLTAAPAAKANPFAGFGGLTADKPAPATTPAFDFGALPKAPAAAATSTSASTKPASSYQEAIEVLNKDFLAFVSERAKENPSVSWIAAVQEYVKYADEIAAKHASTKPVPIDQPVSSKAMVAAAAPAFSTSSFGSSSNGSTSAFSSTSGFSFGATAAAKDDKKKEEPPKPAATTGFSFGGAKKDDATASTATGAFSFGAKPSDAKPVATTGAFSFGAKPDASKDSSAAKPAATTGFSFGNLGGSASTTSAATTSTTATGGFSFGNLSSSSTAASSTSTLKPFNFGAAPTTLNFGGSSAAPAAAPAAAADDDDDENVGREEATVILKSDSPDDDCVFDAEKAKVFEFKKDEKRWADKGLHPLKVLVNKDSKKARILVRNEIGKIVLNSSLYKGMSIKAHETKGKKTGVIVSLQVDGAMTQYLLKVNAAKVDEFTKALEKAAASS